MYGRNGSETAEAIRRQAMLTAGGGGDSDHGGGDFIVFLKLQSRKVITAGDLKLQFSGWEFGENGTNCVSDQ